MTNAHRVRPLRPQRAALSELLRRARKGLLIAGGFLGTGRHRSRQLDRLLEPWINAWTFSHMRWLRPVERVRAAARPRPLPKRHRPLNVSYELDGRGFGLSDLHRRTETTAFVVLHRGAVVHEQYPGAVASADFWRFLLFSLTKSMLSVLVGIAVDEGAIDDLQTPVVSYLPQLRGTAYDGPSVLDLLNMSSGVGDLEDWADPKSTVIRLKNAVNGDGLDRPGDVGQVEHDAWHRVQLFVARRAGAWLGAGSGVPERRCPGTPRSGSGRGSERSMTDSSGCPGRGRGPRSALGPSTPRHGIWLGSAC